MHESAFDKFQVFVGTYLLPMRGLPLRVLDIGSRAIGTGSATHRNTIVDHGWDYFGIDLEPGANVDLVVADASHWHEIDDDSFDVALCSQVLEHARYPWRVLQEIARVLRPRGLTLLIAPSAGHVHRYPEDCFRYYPDGLPALVHASGLRLIESHVQERSVYRDNRWLDAMAVAQKPLLSPEDAGRAHARLELARLSLKAELSREDVGKVDFAPRTVKPSGFGDLATASPRAAFKDRDAELARSARPLWRLGNARMHISKALKALTRPI